MGNKRRRRKKLAMACTGAGEKRTQAPTTIFDLTDDLLEDVLVRVRSPVCLVRAAATCRPWRRMIGGAGFLRRFRSIHGPHQLLGHFIPSKSWKVAKFVPAASPPGMPPIDISESIDLGFLHDYENREWVLTDSRDGLLACVDVSDGVVLVGDPLTYEHVEAVLPPWTGGEALHSCCFGAFLLDADADDTGTIPHMSRFRVLCVRLVKDFGNERYIAMSYVFSAKDRQWLKLSTTDAGNVVLAQLLAQLHEVHANLVGRVAGSIFWSAGNKGTVLGLDETTGKFSVFTLPHPARAYSRHNLRVIASDADTIRLVHITRNYLEWITCVRSSGSCMLDRRYNFSWLMDKWKIREIHHLRLSWEFWDTALELGPGSILISADRDFLPMFSLNVETMRMKGMEVISTDVHLRVFPYEPPWPPTLRASLP